MKTKDKFSEYLEYMRKKGLTEKTIKEHKRFLYGAVTHSILINKEISKLKLTDIAYLIESGKTHGEYGGQRVVCTFRKYLKFLNESGIKIPFDWRDIEVPKVPSKEPIVLDKEELFKVLEAFPISHQNIGAKRMALCMRALCEILFTTGMRISEALSLKKEHLITIQEKKEIIIKGKNSDERIIYFNDRAIEWLERYLEQRNDNSLAMFVNSYGEGLRAVTAKSYLLRFRKKLERIGNKLKFHTFRRTLATQLFENGADIKSVQIILGHKSERTTLKYYIKANKRIAQKVHQEILNKIYYG